MILNRDFDDEQEHIYKKDEKYNEIEQGEDEREEIYKKKSKRSKKINTNKRKEYILYFEVFAIIIIIVLLPIIVRAIFSSSSNKKELVSVHTLENNILNKSIFVNNTNVTLNINTNITIKNEINETNSILNTTKENKTLIEIQKKLNEEKEKLEKIRNELINIYNENGKINVIKFYEEHINQNNYFNSIIENFNHIHINIGFTDDKIDLIIKHISSILYKASKSTYIHIHMMDASALNYDTLIKLSNMIYKINNNTEIQVYNATKVLTDFTIRDSSKIKFSQEYAKLYAFKVLKNIKKILFIDGDDCMVQKDLNELYEMNMRNIYARGITDEPSVRYSMNWMDKYLYDRTHYINGGVMLINLELCQEENFYERAVKLNNNEFYTKTEEPAQDIINTLLRKKIDFFHPKYNKINFYENEEDRNDESKWYQWMEQTLIIGGRNNHFYTKEELIEADKDPVIIHYAWDRYLFKTVKKYEEEKMFYANLTGID